MFVCTELDKFDGSFPISVKSCLYNLFKAEMKGDNFKKVLNNWENISFIKKLTVIQTIHLSTCSAVFKVDFLLLFFEKINEISVTWIIFGLYLTYIG